MSENVPVTSVIMYAPVGSARHGLGVPHAPFGSGGDTFGAIVKRRLPLTPAHVPEARRPPLKPTPQPPTTYFSYCSIPTQSKLIVLEYEQ